MIQGGYNATVDYAKFLSAIGIVLFHSGAITGTFGEASVGYFSTIMVWFMCLALAKGLPNFVSVRAKKLLKTFLIWVAIYIAIVAAVAVVRRKPVGFEILSWLPLSGTFGPLWFLPWAVLVAAALALAFRFIPLEIKNAQHAAVAIVASMAITVACLMIWTSKALPLVLGLCILYVPSVLVGILIYQLRENRTNLVIFAISVSTFGLALSLVGLKGTSQLFLGAPAMVAALLLFKPSLPKSKALGVMSMDIFLVHYLVIGIVAGPLGFNPSEFVGALVVVILSISAALLMNTRIGVRLR